MIKILSDINDFAKTIETNKNVLVDFNAKWCGPCRMMGRIIEGIDENFSDLVFLKVDTDQFPEIAQKFNVSSIPCMFAFQDGKRIYVSINGSEDEFLLGAMPEEEFTTVLKDTFKI